ncbi:hypothetical protein LguiA_029084 [Lonicera macranthoides]
MNAKKRGRVYQQSWGSTYSDLGEIPGSCFTRESLGDHSEMPQNMYYLESADKPFKVFIPTTTKKKHLCWTKFTPHNR